MNKSYKNTRINIIFFTAFLDLSLFSVSLFSATPSYSNFSSNQFAPSGTYTVTVKAKAEMTNTVFRGVGTPAAELHGGWLSTNDTTGSITVMSNASTVWSNGATANSVAITNAGGIMNLEGGPFGTVLQFRFNTSGTPAMIISNGCVGIRLAPPAGFSFGVGGIMKATGDIRTDSSVYPSANLGVSSGFIGVIDKNMMYAPAESYVSFKGKDQTGNGSLPNATNGCAIILLASTNVLSTHETATNTVIGSQGTNLWIGDGITADATYGQFRQFSFQTSGTPVMVISNGMVGIGKSNPGSALDVVGTINGSSDINPGGSSGIKFGANNDIAMSYSTDISGFMRHSALNGFQFKTFSGGTYNEKVRINTNGTVFFRASTVINSNEFPITANFANMTPCGCAFWMSNFTMYLICTNSADGNATTNKLGGL